ncbi:MAG: type II toxin-antitoxin system MqsA family antitoxin [Candidatus Rokubacteria bacterium]|nr:type II toxin-antitoxin system MqsA family antitoxin [Candidatus Rokubacteria bacterium]
MICVVCKQADPARGVATVVFDQPAATIVIKGVPAQVCPNCGEEYVDDATASRLLAMADEAARAGVKVEIREYVAA